LAIVVVKPELAALLPKCPIRRKVERNFFGFGVLFLIDLFFSCHGSISGRELPFGSDVVHACAV
jgi:hypothetical protein